VRIFFNNVWKVSIVFNDNNFLQHTILLCYVKNNQYTNDILFQGLEKNTSITLYWFFLTLHRSLNHYYLLTTNPGYIIALITFKDQTAVIKGDIEIHIFKKTIVSEFVTADRFYS